MSRHSIKERDEFLKFFKKNMLSHYKKNKLKVSKLIVKEFFKEYELKYMLEERIIHTASIILNLPRDILPSILFNKVLTSILNTTENYNKIQEFFKTHEIADNLDEIYIKNKINNKTYIVKTDGCNKTKLKNIDEYVFINKNDNIYLLLSLNHTNLNDIDVYIKNNIHNTSSVTCPLVLLKDLNDRILNGKNWVKHYTFDNKEGYLYFLKIKLDDKITYKVGITSIDLQSRYNKKYEILESKAIKMNMLLASIYEQYIHISNYNIRNYVKHFNHEFDGKHECYHKDLYDVYLSYDINKVIEIISNYNKIKPSIMFDILKSQGVIINEK
jgi:hypothetical protein